MEKEIATPAFGRLAMTRWSKMTKQSSVIPAKAGIHAILFWISFVSLRMTVQISIWIPNQVGNDSIVSIWIYVSQ